MAHWSKWVEVLMLSGSLSHARGIASRLLMSGTRVSAVVVLLLVAGVWVAGRASAAGITCPPGQTGVGPAGSQICVSVTSSGSKGSSGPGQGSSSGGASGCSYQGRAIPCTYDGTWWFAAHACYAAPGASLPGVFPSTPGSSWWVCDYGPTFGLPPNAVPFTVPDGQAPIANPATLAQNAVSSIQLPTAVVDTAPKPPHPEVVGVEVWLWIPQSQWLPLSRTVRAGATSVTATAVPNLVTWNMGDGSPAFQCGDAGRPWRSSYTDAAQTDCGYTYRTLSARKPDGVFQITATISYFVTWTCTGACTSTTGNLGLVAAPAGRGSIQSVQRQTVVVTP